MWTVILSSQAAGFYETLEEKHRRQVASALDRVAANPHRGKALKGELRGYWSYRVGMYRILYSIQHAKLLVLVLRIQHRKEVYERFRR
jgi:mRNA interferase RelE/StbE